MNDRKSETPRTDEKWFEAQQEVFQKYRESYMRNVDVVEVDLARELERELTAAHEQIAEMRVIIQTIADNTDCEFASCGVACSGYISALQEKAK